MKYPRYKLQSPEPGETGTGPADTSASTELPASTVIESGQAAETGTTDAPSTQDKIGALLDNIGKDDGQTGDDGQVDKPAATEDKPVAAVKPVAKPADAKPADTKTAAKPDDLTPPEGMNERASARWAQLTERVKAVPELERRATEAEGQVNSLRELVTSSGLQADEFTGMIEMGRLFKSSKPEDMQAALARIDEIRTDLATRLGIDAPGADPLAKHADLLAEVEDMSITRTRALEIAKLRDQGARVQASTTAQQQEQEFHTGLKTAASAMDQAIEQRAGTPGHLEKVAFIKGKLADPVYAQQFVTTYRPEQWQSVILTMYDAYTPPAAPPAPRGPSGHQPLRSGNSSSGVRQLGANPVTSEQAVANAFDSLGL